MADKLIAAVAALGQPPDQIFEVGGVMKSDQDPDLQPTRVRLYERRFASSQWKAVPDASSSTCP